MKKQHRMFWQKERTNRTTLTYFPLTSLPLDAGLEVVCQVLGFLHPMDLFAVAQVSRLMRAIILNRKIARDVWRNAYRRHPDLPAPPSTISEPRWTFLCFGPDICSMCGDRGATPFFAFSKKYCLDCSGDFTALPANIKDAAGKHLGIRDPVWDLLPYERTLTGFRYHIPDVESVLKKLTLMQILIDHKVKSLTAIFNTDKSLLLARASERKKCSLKALRWRATFIGLASSEQRIALRVASDKIFELLCGLGYRPWDINQARLERLLEGSRVHNLKAIKRGPELRDRGSSRPDGIVTGPRDVIGHLKKQYRLSCRMNRWRISHIKSFKLPDLSTDIGLIVFEFLHPIDLYHLGLTSKRTRGIILNKSLCSPVWKKAYKRHPDVPAPPRSIPEPRWTQLLYGPDICMVCGRNGAKSLFSFLKRYCPTCEGNLIIRTDELQNHLGAEVRLQNIVLPLLPHENYVWGNGHQKLHDISDVRTMMRKVAVVQVLIDRRVTKLSHIFAGDQKVLKERVAGIDKSSVPAKSLLSEHGEQAYIEFCVFAEFAVQRCSKWLTGMGYKPWAIDAYNLDKVLRSARVRKATLRVFHRLLPEIQQSAIYTDPRDIYTRKRLLTGMYAYYEHHPDGAWTVLPHSDLTVKVFLENHYDESMELEDMERLFPKVIATTAQDEKLRFANLLPNHLMGATSSGEDQICKVDLAAATFSCVGCHRREDRGVQIGWKAICLHMRNYGRDARGNCLKYSFNDKVSYYASLIVSLSGLDPCTASDDDMDQRNDRFICGVCRPSRRHRVSFLPTYTWFDMLLHLWHGHCRKLLWRRGEGFIPSFHLLSPATKDFVVDHESIQFRDKWHIWRCNKCHAHDSHWVSWPEIRSHTLTKHLIDEPEIGKDIVRMKHAPIQSRHCRVKLRVEPDLDCVCLKCPEPWRRTLFTEEVVLRHLRSNHAVSSPSKDVDWIKIKIVQATYPSNLPFSNIRIV
ncbi:hypothetical protein CVT26_006422 [Gymnopilus dilepis]|uniref:F-box domain-containing protein n=1 Tax=Gymnopilus dilepis TaxID=231916 RepID=A0A409Y1R7_9AGAR|nr:hypothetical protein CVT26_006422 [Gymnopilus dilepis]